MKEDDSKLYLQASEEVENNTQVEALWLKAMALTGGNEEKAGYKYIKLRVQQLKNEPLDNVPDDVNYHSSTKEEQEAEPRIEKTDTTTERTFESNTDVTIKEIYKFL